MEQILKSDSFTVVNGNGKFYKCRGDKRIIGLTIGMNDFLKTHETLKNHYVIPWDDTDYYIPGCEYPILSIKQVLGTQIENGIDGYSKFYILEGSDDCKNIAITHKLIRIEYLIDIDKIRTIVINMKGGWVKKDTCETFSENLSTI